MVEQEKIIIHGNVDLDIIKEVKKSVNIPVIGNGDIKSVEDAKKMLEYTHVDGIMIGRATIGNPWIIKNIINYLKEPSTYKEFLPTKDDKKNMIIKHLELLCEEKGEKVAVKEMRKHIAHYVKNLPNATTLREKVNVIEDKENLIKTILEF